MTRLPPEAPPLPLSRKEKLEQLAIAEAKERAARRAKPFYDPHGEQLEVHRLPHQQRFVFSGNGWGKTTFAIQEAFACALGKNPWTSAFTKVPAKVLFVLDSPEKIEEKILPEAKKWFNIEDLELVKAGHPYIKYIRFPNGSTIQFMFFDQDPMKFEGIDGIDFIVADEPFPRHIYVGLFRGTREKGSNPRLLIVGTPLAAPWLRTDIYEPWSRGELPQVHCIFGHSSANRANLRDGWLEEFTSLLTEKERATRTEGRFFDLDGLALAGIWNRKIHIIPVGQPQTAILEQGMNAIVVVDPHPRKAHIAVLFLFSADEEMIAVKGLSSRAVPKQFAHELAAFCEGFNVVDVVCDSLGSSELTGGYGNLSFISVVNNEWAEEGLELRMRATTYHEKDDESWIAMIQEYLLIPMEPDNFGRRLPKFRCFEQVKGLIFDVENAAWYTSRDKEVVKPKIDMTKRDYLSCLKYALAAQPSINRKRRIRTREGSAWGGPASNRGANPGTETKRASSRLYYLQARARRKDWRNF